MRLDLSKQGVLVDFHGLNYVILVISSDSLELSWKLSPIFAFQCALNLIHSSNREYLLVMLMFCTVGGVGCLLVQIMDLSNQGLVVQKPINTNSRLQINQAIFPLSPNVVQR